MCIRDNARLEMATYCIEVLDACGVVHLLAQSV